MEFYSWLKTSLQNVSQNSVNAVLTLKEEGATVPFMARYRKERTGNLDEVQIQKILDQREEWDELTQRQQYIVGEIEKQGKLTDGLKAQVLSCFDSRVLEDLYLPYKQKRKSKAALAKEAGLEPLAQWIWDVAHGTVKREPGQTLEIWAFAFKNEEKGFVDSLAAQTGAADILIEKLSENLLLRQVVRDHYSRQGFIRTTSAQKVKPNSKYSHYFDYEEKLASLLEPKNSHRYLALRRGWIEEELSIQMGAAKADEDFDSILTHAFEKETQVREYQKNAETDLDPKIVELLEKVARVALRAHVVPSIENEFHKQLKEVADRMAIEVFSENVRKILLAAPYGPKPVLGVDPGVRTGCKLAVIDQSGKFIRDTVIKLNTDSEKEQAKTLLVALAESGSISAVVVGNGTAGRETENFIRDAFKEKNISVPVVMVNEAGASVYSASAVAREEFPDLDVTVRGAISIARRFQDPLAELVKIDPKSIGVGQYQHDVSQNGLKRALETVVESSVNSVGANLNTASKHLLAHVSGIGEALAQSIVEYREKNGLFRSRTQLLEVPRFSKKAFELAAGFLRVPESESILDRTGVHPEKYEALQGLAKTLNQSVEDWVGGGAKALLKLPEAKEALGEFTLKDIVAELARPGRDPRDTFKPVQFRDDLRELKDVKPEMICPGVVTNVTNFGAFVDIGVHQDGLVHISQLGNRYVSDPREVVSPGDSVTVKVLEINLEKKQLALTMKVAENKRSGAASTGVSTRDSKTNSSKRNSNPARSKPIAPVAPAKTLVVSYQDSSPPPVIPRVSAPVPSRPMPSRPMPSKSTISAIKPAKAASAFNNPFAQLAVMKSQLKK